MVDVLLVSSLSERYYYDPFIQSCESRGIKVSILDPEQFIETNASLHVELDDVTPHGYIDLIRLGDDVNTVSRTPIENIGVAWYLRVNRTIRVRDIAESTKRFIWNETLCAISALLSVLTCPWINTLKQSSDSRAISWCSNNTLMQ